MNKIKIRLRWRVIMTDSGLLERLTSQNTDYASQFIGKDVPGQAAKGLLILTCMDSRILPHEIFGLALGDAKVIRNAGGQLNPEVEMDIILASHLLNCHSIIIMPHTRCAMASMSLSAAQQRLTEISGKDFSNFRPRLIDDAEEKLRSDVSSLQNNSLIKDGVKVFGAIYDVDSGTVNWVE